MREFYFLSDAEKQEIMGRITSFLQSQNDVRFAYIFGSFLEKENIGFHDIDVAVFLDSVKIKKKNIFDYENNLAIQLGRAISFSADRIDLKVLNFVPKNFQSNIFSRGSFLFSKDDAILTGIIEDSSLESALNYEFSRQSLRELIS